MTDPTRPGSRVADAMLRSPKTLPADATVETVAMLFRSAHVHAALIVDATGILLTVVEPDDIADVPASAIAAGCGELRGRTVSPTSDLADTRAAMERLGRRRLAVVDETMHVVGLLCLKRSGSGFCSDDDVAARAADPR